MPGIEGQSVYAINKDGFRGDLFANNQTYRIIAIGGSTTECLYLDENESWPYLVQEELNARNSTNQKVWIGNVGVSGHSSRNHIVQAARLTDQYPEVDALLLLVGANDLLLRLQQDEEFKPFSSVENLSDSEYEALMNRSFSIWPGADSNYFFIKRTEVWRKLRILKNKYFTPPPEGVAQDKMGEVYIDWRNNRIAALELRQVLPDLSSSLKEYAMNIKNIIRDAESKNIRVILMTQPTIWRNDLSEKEQRHYCLTGKL